ncbi:MAG: LLM class flavin-dependent oxidoreductase [Chloroflexi bacterium]|nr:LLM class flavin-dependent oxidoreductase [Chloroflexota bacterium]
MSVTASHRPLRVGLFLPLDERATATGALRWADVLALAREAEAVGFDSLWLPDHLLYRFAGAPPTGQWECWTVLAGLAVATSRVTLGTLVVATSFREPALLAKMADTADEISGGRLVLGLGAGYHKPEYTSFGYPYDHRASRFEEAILIITGLLRQGHIDFVGRFYQVRDCELRPRGPRPAGPPIVVGARGARMLQATARLADGWNAWLAFAPDQLASLPVTMGEVDVACLAVGRDPGTLTRSVTICLDPLGDQSFAFRPVRPEIAPVPIVGTPAALAQTLRGLAAAGIDEVQVYLPTCTLAAVAAFGAVLANLDE